MGNILIFEDYLRIPGYVRGPWIAPGDTVDILVWKDEDDTILDLQLAQYVFLEVDPKLGLILAPESDFRFELKPTTFQRTRVPQPKPDQFLLRPLIFLFDLGAFRATTKQSGVRNASLRTPYPFRLSHEHRSGTMRTKSAFAARAEPFLHFFQVSFRSHG